MRDGPYGVVVGGLRRDHRFVFLLIIILFFNPGVKSANLFLSFSVWPPHSVSSCRSRRRGSPRVSYRSSLTLFQGRCGDLRGRIRGHGGRVVSDLRGHGLDGAPSVIGPAAAHVVKGRRVGVKMGVEQSSRGSGGVAKVAAGIAGAVAAAVIRGLEKAQEAFKMHTF